MRRQLVLVVIAKDAQSLVRKENMSIKEELDFEEKLCNAAENVVRQWDCHDKFRMTDEDQYQFGEPFDVAVSRAYLAEIAIKYADHNDNHDFDESDTE